MTRPGREDRIRRLRDRLPGIIYGGDYNPEQWTPAVWREDVKLMRSANVRLVSLGVFSWAALEPKDGAFECGWLDEVVDLLHTQQIAVNLATPNGSPPPWLAEDFPETLLTDRNGLRVGVGSRGHFCPSSPVYRDRSLRIARQLAERYGDHPAVVMWHIGNEYHAECFCDLCDDRFRSWLLAKYADLDELNHRWGTAFWGQTYSAWDQVHLPRPVRGRVNPARELDFARFNSANQLELYRAERDLLHDITPDLPATTNFVQYFRLNDYRRWAPELDVIAYDSYPDPAQPNSLIDAALQYDLMRSLGQGRPWMLMEQAAAGVSQWRLNLVKQPGQMRLGSYQAVAHGADAVMFFQWRASRYGQEKFHSAMLPHGGTSSASWRAVRDLGNELGRLDQLATANTTADVAIVWDWENWWAVEGCFHPDNTYNYRDAVTSHYRALWHAQLAVDVVTLDDDLSRYRVVVVPNQYLITENQRTALCAYVHNGGHALISYFSGIVDHDDQVWPNSYPGGLRHVIGAHIHDLSPMPPGAVTPIAGTADRLLGEAFSAAGSRWQDELLPEAARTIATYTDGPLAGQAAATDHQLGAGSVIYLGTRLDDTSLEILLGALLDRAGVVSPHPAPRGVEVAQRETETHRYLFLLNHNPAPVVFNLQRNGTDLLTGQQLNQGDNVTLKPTDVLIVRTAS